MYFYKNEKVETYYESQTNLNHDRAIILSATPLSRALISKIIIVCQYKTIIAIEVLQSKKCSR